MNRQGIRSGLIVVFACCTTVLQAQEPFVAGDSKGWEIPGNPELYAPQTITLPELIPFSEWNPSSKFKLFHWEQALNEKVSKERAWEQSVLVSGAYNNTKRFEVHVNAATLNFRIGNNPASWSISTGSHLDARTLSFPAPRHLTPGKQVTGGRVAPNGQIKR